MSNKQTQQKLIVFTAPSGAGKTTIVKHLINEFDFLSFSVSATTRDKRTGENDGIDYYFLHKMIFNDLIARDAFVEYEEVYDNQKYGTLKSEVERRWESGKSIVFDVDVKGATKIKEYYKDQCLVVFVKPPSLDILIERLKNRDSESEVSLKKRIARVEREMKYESTFDMVLVNDLLDVALKEAEFITQDFLMSNHEHVNN